MPEAQITFIKDKLEGAMVYLEQAIENKKAGIE